MAGSFVAARKYWRAQRCTLLLLAVVLSSHVQAKESSSPHSLQRIPAPSDQLQKWVEELASPMYEVRQNATEALFDAGPTGLKLLSVAARGADLEAADRATWVLESLACSEDQETRLAALGELCTLSRFPRVQAAAIKRLAQVRELICRDALERCGADFLVRRQYRSERGAFTGVEITLDGKWRGSPDELVSLGDLTHVSEVKLRGSAVDDRVLSYLRAMPHLDSVVLYDTRVSPQGVATLKRERSNVRVRSQNRAKLGINYEVAETGVGIESVVEDSAASIAGLKPGDVIVKFNDTPISDFDLLTAHIAQHQPGSEVQLAIRRDDRPMSVTVRLGQW